MDLIEQLLRVLTLVAWLSLFLWLLQSPADSEARNLAAFLNPKLWWLISGGLWMAILLILATITKPTTGNNVFPWAALGQNLILILPLLFFPLAKGISLSPEAFEKRLATNQLNITSLKSAEQSLDEKAYELSRQLGSPATLQDEDSIKKIPLSLLTATSDKYMGKEVEVIGRVLRSDKLPAHTFLCLRFVMSCCIADARTVGVGVSHEGLAVPAAEAWIRLRGRFEIKLLDGNSLPFIEADSIEIIPEPDMPYLFM